MKHNTTTGLSDCTILYTTTDGKKINIDKDAFGIKIVTHSYRKEGIIKFDKPITKIPAYAFSQCTTLLTVTIPESVKSFYTSSFLNCYSIQKYNHSFASDDKRCIIVNGVLKLFASGNISEYEMPNNIVKIGKGVFRCSKLKKVIISEGVHIIDDCAFQFCKNLSEVIIPNGVSEIGQSAFSNCTKLKSITIPNSVTKIGDWAFVGCKSLLEFNSPLATSDKRCLIIDRELVAFASAGITNYVFPSEIVSYNKTVFDHTNKLKGLQKSLDQRSYNTMLIVPERKEEKNSDVGGVIISITASGYIKKTLKSEFPLQEFGSDGIHRNYYSERIKVLREATLWDTLFLFTERGRFYKINVADIPNANVQEKGFSLFDKFGITDDGFSAILPTRNLINSDNVEKYSILIMTREGRMVRNKLSDYKKVENGTCAISLATLDDIVTSASLLQNNDYVFNCSTSGFGKSFEIGSVRISSLKSKCIGVCSFTLTAFANTLIGMDTTEIAGCGYSYDSAGRLKRDFDNLSGTSYLLITERGIICRTFTRLDSRFKSGIKLIKLDSNDRVISNMFVVNTNNVLIVTAKGVTMRLDVAQIKIEKPGGKGKVCIKLLDDDKIVACCKMSAIESATVTLDEVKVNEYRQQTIESQLILSDIFDEEPNEEINISNDNNITTKEMLSLLFTKEQWNKNELVTICKSKGLMLGSILEEINDYSYSVVDDVVLEDEGDTISVIMDYKAELL